MGLGGKQNVMNHLGLQITSMTVPFILLCLQVQGIECAGYGTDIILYIMFARLICSTLKWLQSVHVLEPEVCCTMLVAFSSFLQIVALDTSSGILHLERGPFLRYW